MDNFLIIYFSLLFIHIPSFLLLISTSIYGIFTTVTLNGITNFILVSELLSYSTVSGNKGGNKSFSLFLILVIFTIFMTSILFLIATIKITNGLFFAETNAIKIKDGINMEIKHFKKYYILDIIILSFLAWTFISSAQKGEPDYFSMNFNGEQTIHKLVVLALKVIGTFSVVYITVLLMIKSLYLSKLKTNNLVIANPNATAENNVQMSSSKILNSNSWNNVEVPLMTMFNNLNMNYLINSNLRLGI